MAKIRIIKKNNDCSMEYEVGDICEVTGTWYGGVHINGRSGIPVSLDKEEYMELNTEPEEPDSAENENTLYSISKENGYLRILPNISIKSWQ